MLATLFEALSTLTVVSCNVDDTTAAAAAESLFFPFFYISLKKKKITRNHIHIFSCVR